MNSKGEKQLKTIRALAVKNNFTIAFLTKQINLGRLVFEKKGKTIYSSQFFIEQYKKNFTFSGFMLDRTFSKAFEDSNCLQSKKNKKKKRGKIIKEDEIEIDIEEAFVEKWNKDFKKINNDFEDLLNFPNKKETKKIILKKDLSLNPHNVYSAIITVSILFLLSFYTVSFAPNTAESFTKKIDSIISVPHVFINKLAIAQIINNDKDDVKYEVPSSAQLSKFIKNKVSKISYPAGTSLSVAKNEITGKVAGIEEDALFDNLSIFDKIKNITIEVFTKISDKQKKSSLELNNRLNILMSPRK